MQTVRRVFDAAIALGALVICVPLLTAAAIGIKVTSPGPVLYRSQRIGRDRRRRPAAVDTAYGPSDRRRQPLYGGREFTMYKLRTMRIHSGGVGDPITAANDSRVFRFGAWLRAARIDELPQLFNIVKGEMAFVGPRPEAPEIVRRHYTEDDLATLQILPGLTSPGTIYYYTHCQAMLAGDTVVEKYVDRLLPLKLSLDRVYIKRATIFYDVRVIVRTIVLIVGQIAGRHRFADPPELAEIDAPMARPRVSRTFQA